MRKAILAVVASLYCAPAPAADTLWRCWYDGRMEIECRLERHAGPRATAAERVQGRILLNQPYPVRAGRPPPALRVIREHPGWLEGEPVRIPLLGQVDDMGFAAELAGSVMCARRPACLVLFHATAREAAEAAAGEEM